MNKLITLSALFFFINVAPAFAYEIGSIGPESGIIMYKAITAEDSTTQTAYYLEVSPPDEEKTGTWQEAVDACNTGDWTLPEADVLTLIYDNFRNKGVGDFKKEAYQESEESDYTGLYWTATGYGLKDKGGDQTEAFAKSFLNGTTHHLNKYQYSVHKLIPLTEEDKNNMTFQDKKSKKLAQYTTIEIEVPAATCSYRCVREFTKTETKKNLKKKINLPGIATN